MFGISYYWPGRSRDWYVMIQRLHVILMWAQVKTAAWRHYTILHLNINWSVVGSCDAGHERKAYLINLAGHPWSIPGGNISDQYKPAWEPSIQLRNHLRHHGRLSTQFDVGQETAEDLEALTMWTVWSTLQASLILTLAVIYCWPATNGKNKLQHLCP